MRVEFINSSGGRMYVDESRIDEYKAAGFKLAAKNIPRKESSDTIEEPAKRSRRKKED